MNLKEVVSFGLGGHTVTFEEDLKEFVVIVHGGAYSAECRYLKSAPGKQKTSVRAVRCVQPGTPLFSRLIRLASNAIADANSSECEPMHRPVGTRGA